MQGLLPLRRYFDFHGRSGRAEFWQFSGLLVIAVVVGLLFDTIFRQLDMPAFTLLVIAGAICPYYAVATRRLHDRGMSGKWLAAHAVITLFSYAMLKSADHFAYSEQAQTQLWVARASDLIVRGFVGFFFYHFIKRGEGIDNKYGPPPGVFAPELNPTARTEQAQMPVSQSIPPARVRPSDTTDPLDQIERLARMKDAGVLTNEEFQQQKAACLARL